MKFGNWMRAIVATTAVAAMCFTAVAGQHKASKPKTVVDVATSSEDFSTLVAALKAAELVEPLQGDGPFTVFAPTNKAFENLPDGTLDALLSPENNDKLTAVLTYHVVPGKVLAEDVVELDSASTLSGETLRIKTKDGKVYINDAQVIKTDIMAGNGVVHVIDAVLVPQM